MACVHISHFKQNSTLAISYILNAEDTEPSLRVLKRRPLSMLPVRLRRMAFQGQTVREKTTTLLFRQPWTDLRNMAQWDTNFGFVFLLNIVSLK